MRNLDNYPYSEKDGEYGGNSCLKEGLVIDDENWLIKYPRNAAYLKRHEELEYTNDTVSEYLGSHIYALLGYPVHDTFLATRNNKIVVACKDFLKDNERLVELRTLKNSANNIMSERLERDFSSTGSDRVIEFEEILIHLQYNQNLAKVPGIKKRFYDQLVIDALINNSDRNNGNWGIIRSRGKLDRLAPVFDNGGSFNGKTPDSRLLKMLEDNNSSTALDAVMIYGEHGERYLLRDIFNKDIPDLNAALIRNIPIIRVKMPEIYNLINSVEKIACSDIRKEFYIKTLTERFEKILIPAYNRAISQKKEIQTNKTDDFMH